MTRLTTHFHSQCYMDTIKIADAFYEAVSNSSNFQNNKKMVIGFNGEIGSGKSTLSKAFSEHFPVASPVEDLGYRGFSYKTPQGLSVKRFDVLGMLMSGEDMASKIAQYMTDDIVLVEHADALIDMGLVNTFDLTLTTHFTDGRDAINVANMEYLHDLNEPDVDFTEQRMNILNNEQRIIEISDMEQKSFNNDVFLNALAKGMG